MNNKHKKTLHAVFSMPTSASIRFCDAESMLAAIGAEKTEGAGSRVRFALKGEELMMHKPHPCKEMKRYQVEQMREFLTRLEIMP